MPEWLSRWWQLVNSDERDQAWRYKLIEKLDLQPNDIIVVSVQARTREVEIARLKAQLAADFPDNMVVVLPARSRLSVLRPSSKEEPQP